MAGGMLNIVESAPGSCEEIFGTMAKGYSKGKRAQFMLGFPFNEHWTRPLHEVREAAGLTSP
jgi:ubiquinone biosynthesis protein Coq4